jgi:serine/threonine-protein kinase
MFRCAVMEAAILGLACTGCYQSSAEDDSGRDDGAGDDAAVDHGSDDSAIEDVTDDAPTTEPCPSNMVRVPAGPVVVGSDPGEGDTDEEPEHVVVLSEFCIDTFEVTNRDWLQCQAGGGCSRPHASGSRTRLNYIGSPEFDDFPVINVDWNEATAYCAWVGKRLPTEAEWEKAARGGCEVVAPASCGPEDERTYPWGDAAPDCTLANFVACVGDTTPVDAHPAGASPYGAMNLADNVSEWVADWYAGSIYATCADGSCVDPQGPPSGSERVHRGGSWESTAAYVRCANRFRQVDGYSFDNLGFRCAASLAH